MTPFSFSNHQKKKKKQQKQQQFEHVTTPTKATTPTSAKKQTFTLQSAAGGVSTITKKKGSKGRNILSYHRTTGSSNNSTSTVHAASKTPTRKNSNYSTTPIPVTSQPNGIFMTTTTTNSSSNNNNKTSNIILYPPSGNRSGGSGNNSSGVTGGTGGTGGSIIIVDDNPGRLVNPLAELGPPLSSNQVVVPNHKSSSLLGVTKSRGLRNNDGSIFTNDNDNNNNDNDKSDNNNNNKTKSVHHGKAKKTSKKHQNRIRSSGGAGGGNDKDDVTTGTTTTTEPTTNTVGLGGMKTTTNTTVFKKQKQSQSGVGPTPLYITMNDWLPLHDIWFSPPDTYPITYWARLLGLSLIVSKKKNQNKKEVVVLVNDENKMDIHTGKEVEEDPLDPDSSHPYHIDPTATTTSTTTTITKHKNRHYDDGTIQEVVDLARAPSPSESTTTTATNTDDTSSEQCLTLEQMMECAQILKHSSSSHHHHHQYHSNHHNNDMDSIYQIPIEGTFAEQIWKGKQKQYTKYNNHHHEIFQQQQQSKNQMMNHHLIHTTNTTTTTTTTTTTVSSLQQQQQQHDDDDSFLQEDERILGTYRDPLYEQLLFYSTQPLEREFILGKLRPYNSNSNSNNNMSRSTEQKQPEPQPQQQQNDQSSDLSLQQLPLNSSSSHTNAGQSILRKGGSTSSATTIRRRPSYHQDDTNKKSGETTCMVVVVPVTVQEYSKIRLPLFTMLELINTVRTYCCYRWEINLPWKKLNQKKEYDSICNNILFHENESSVLPKNINWIHPTIQKEKEENPEEESDNDDTTTPQKQQQQQQQQSYYYTFHTLSQATILYPQLANELNQIILHQQTLSKTSAAAAATSVSSVVAAAPGGGGGGVVDGFVAILHHSHSPSPQQQQQHQTTNSKLKNDQYHHDDNEDNNNNKIKDKTEEENISSHNKEWNNKQLLHHQCPNDPDIRTKQTELNPKSTFENPLNEETQFVEHSNLPEKSDCVMSVAAFLTYQFVWFRSKNQTAEESELIIRVLAIEILDQANRKEEVIQSTTSVPDTNEMKDGPFTNSLDPNHVTNTLTNSHSNIEKQTQHEDQPLLCDELRLVLISLLVTVANACSVWYAVFPSHNRKEQTFFESIFRMVTTTTTTAVAATTTTTEGNPDQQKQQLDDRSNNHDNNNSSRYETKMMICDMQKISHRYAMMSYKQQQQNNQKKKTGDKNDKINDTAEALDFCAPKRRWLVRLPMVEDLSIPMQSDKLNHETDSLHESMGSVGTLSHHQRGGKSKRSIRQNQTDTITTHGNMFSSASTEMRDVTISVRARLKSVLPIDKTSCTTGEEVASTTSNTMELLYIRDDGSDGDVVVMPPFPLDPPSLDFMRDFLLPQTEKVKDSINQTSEILDELVLHQRALETLEKGLEPKLKSLFRCVLDERIEHENFEADLRRLEEKRILAENKKMLDRKKELDQVWQKQLEQDQDAVCDICNDGDVTPDNQILFCEACNVAVHQYCYGIEKVPDGDYFCLPCIRLGRDKRQAGAPPQPLPISCELCPLRQGAFVRTDMKNSNSSNGAVDRWVHSVCAKWQGLQFVEQGNPELVEDVTEIKANFRRHGIKCDLCLGEYGAMNKCMGGDELDEDGKPSCNKWFHVTCSRAVGNLRVIHGENCRGPVAQNPWKLICPEHSNLSPDEIPTDALPIEKIIMAAKEFPPEPKPTLQCVARKPFNTATGPEREYLLSIPEYENELMIELLTKKFHGVRCEVCDIVEEDSKNLTRCASCHVVFCNACKILPDEYKGNFYYCPSCIYLGEKKKKAGNDDPTITTIKTPNCSVCYQKGGFLRKAIAETQTRKTYWKTNDKEFQKTYFAKDLWCHSLCAFWHPKLILPIDTGLVDLSNVLLSNGKAFIQNRTPCYLCGNNGGMKVHCAHDGCRICDSYPTAFHVTCARQAGLEVGLSESDDLQFHVHCYRHGGNAFNLRAKLEDMIEVEKRRAGKDLSRSDAPMKFSNASKILNGGIQVIRILGWAWRWAEWWVDSDSSWEPLLEPGQKEEEMTNEELKIVGSTRESRCHDARRCRLAAFGAALRNRAYDTNDGFKNDALHRALTAIMHTKSLVGPLEKYEIDFFVEWLGRAYRSKSRLMFIGEDKNIVSEKSPFCIVSGSQKPKYELNDRPIPGENELPPRQVFENPVDFEDNFMLDGSNILIDSPKEVTSAHKSSSRSKKITAASDEHSRYLKDEMSTVLDNVDSPIGKIDISSMKPPKIKKMTTPKVESRIDHSDHVDSSVSVSTGTDMKPKLAKRKIDMDIDSFGPVESKKMKSKKSNENKPSNAAKAHPSRGSGSTELSRYDISKWNATPEARNILLEVSEISPFIQCLVVAASKRGVQLQEVNLTTGEKKGPYPSMTKASAACGLNMNTIGNLIRGEIPSVGEWIWQYVYSPEKRGRSPMKSSSKSKKKKIKIETKEALSILVGQTQTENIESETVGLSNSSENVPTDDPVQEQEVPSSSENVPMDDPVQAQELSTVDKMEDVVDGENVTKVIPEILSVEGVIPDPSKDTSINDEIDCSQDAVLESTPNVPLANETSKEFPPSHSSDEVLDLEMNVVETPLIVEQSNDTVIESESTFQSTEEVTVKRRRGRPALRTTPEVLSGVDEKESDMKIPVVSTETLLRTSLGTDHELDHHQPDVCTGELLFPNHSSQRRRSRCRKGVIVITNRSLMQKYARTSQDIRSALRKIKVHRDKENKIFLEKKLLLERGATVVEQYYRPTHVVLAGKVAHHATTAAAITVTTTTTNTDDNDDDDNDDDEDDNLPISQYATSQSERKANRNNLLKHQKKSKKKTHKSSNTNPRNINNSGQVHTKKNSHKKKK